MCFSCALANMRGSKAAGPVYEGGRAVDPKSILYRCAIAAQVAKPKYKFLGKKFYDDTEHALPHFAVGLAKLRI